MRTRIVRAGKILAVAMIFLAGYVSGIVNSVPSEADKTMRMSKMLHYRAEAGKAMDTRPEESEKALDFYLRGIDFEVVKVVVAKQ